MFEIRNGAENVQGCIFPGHEPGKSAPSATTRQTRAGHFSRRPSQSADVVQPSRKSNYWATLTAGGFHVPSIIEGGVCLGQYSRIIGMNLAFGAGSQFASFALPGESA